jgi:hypothetical protein
MIRRTITLALCAAAFWGGMRFQTWQLDGACTRAGGQTNANGLCIGARP